MKRINRNIAGGNQTRTSVWILNAFQIQRVQRTNRRSCFISNEVVNAGVADYWRVVVVIGIGERNRSSFAFRSGFSNDVVVQRPVQRLRILLRPDNQDGTIAHLTCGQVRVVGCFAVAGNVVDGNITGFFRPRRSGVNIVNIFAGTEDDVIARNRGFVVV